MSGDQCFQWQMYTAQTECTEHQLFLIYSLNYTLLKNIKCTVQILWKILYSDSLVTEDLHYK